MMRHFNFLVLLGCLLSLIINPGFLCAQEIEPSEMKVNKGDVLQAVIDQREANNDDVDDVVEQAVEKVRTKEKPVSDTMEKVIEKAVIEDRELSDVEKKVIKTSVVDGVDLSENVEAAIEQSMTGEKEMTPEVERAISSTVSKDAEAESSRPLSAGANDVTSQIDNLATDREQKLIEDYVIGERWLTPFTKSWYTLTGWMHETFGLNFGLAYTALYQKASKGQSPTEAAGGDFDFFGRWQFMGRKGGNKGLIGFNTELRNRIGQIPPSDLWQNINSLWRTTSGFNVQEFSLVQLYWHQEIKKDKLFFRLGKVDLSDFINDYTFNSSNFYFVNEAFTDNPAIAFPGNGNGAIVGYAPTDLFYMVAGIADANGVKTALDTQRLFEADEYFYSFELGLRPNFKDVGRGTYALTFWSKDAQKELGLEGDEGVALTIEQTFMKNFTPFLRYSYSTGDYTDLRASVVTGFGITEMFWRPKDVMGVGYAWGVPSKRQVSQQHTFEVFYRYQLSSYIQLTPGVQWIVNSGDVSLEDDVTILQLRGRVAF